MNDLQRRILIAPQNERRAEQHVGLYFIRELGDQRFQSCTRPFRIVLQEDLNLRFQQRSLALRQAARELERTPQMPPFRIEIALVARQLRDLGMRHRELGVENHCFLEQAGGIGQSVGVERLDSFVKGTIRVQRTRAHVGHRALVHGREIETLADAESQLIDDGEDVGAARLTREQQATRLDILHLDVGPDRFAGLEDVTQDHRARARSARDLGKNRLIDPGRFLLSDLAQDFLDARTAHDIETGSLREIGEKEARNARREPPNLLVGAVRAEFEHSDRGTSRRAHGRARFLIGADPQRGEGKERESKQGRKEHRQAVTREKRAFMRAGSGRSFRNDIGRPFREGRDCHFRCRTDLGLAIVLGRGKLLGRGIVIGRAIDPGCAGDPGPGLGLLTKPFQVIAKQVGIPISLRRVLSQAPADDPIQLVRHGRIAHGDRRRVIPEDRGQDGDRSRTPKWFLPGCHLVEKDPQREHVRRWADRLAFGLLRRHVMNCPENPSQLRQTAR